MQFASERENPVIWFQPIIDTTDSRVFAHQCLYAGNPARTSNSVLKGLSVRRRNGLLFMDISGASPQTVLTGIDSPLWKIVCQFRITDPLIQFSFLRRARALCAEENCGFAAEARNAEEETMCLLDSLRPHYIKIDQSLVRNIEEPSHARSVRRLVQAADDWGAVVIATGVRDYETVENLWLLGIRNMQGDLFGTPESSIFSDQKAQRRLVNPVCAW